LDGHGGVFSIYIFVFFKKKKKRIRRRIRERNREKIDQKKKPIGLYLAIPWPNILAFVGLV
jgi:hypothetical protein